MKLWQCCYYRACLVNTVPDDNACSDFCVLAPSNKYLFGFEIEKSSEKWNIFRTNKKPMQVLACVCPCMSLSDWLVVFNQDLSTFNILVMMIHRNLLKICTWVSGIRNWNRGNPIICSHNNMPNNEATQNLGTTHYKIPQNFTWLLRMKTLQCSTCFSSSKFTREAITEGVSAPCRQIQCFSFVFWNQWYHDKRY